MPDIGFNGRHFGVNAKEGTLCRLHRIIGRVIGFAQGFEFGLDIALTGRGFFKLNLCRGQTSRQCRGISSAFQQANRPQLLLRPHEFGLQALIALGHLSLAFQTTDLRTELLADVFQASEVLTRIGQAALGLFAAFLVARHTCGFFQEYTQLFRLRFNNARHRALTNNGVGTRPQPRSHEQIGHVLTTHLEVIDEVV